MKKVEIYLICIILSLTGILQSCGTREERMAQKAARKEAKHEKKLEKKIEKAEAKREAIKKEDYDVYGVDVSHHNGKINWRQVGKVNVHFCFIKATEGKDNRDKMFKKNWRRANRANLFVSPYHFFRQTNRKGTEQQAKNFLETIKKTMLDLPPVLDVEVYNRRKGSVNHMRTEMKRWLDIVEKERKVKPIIYTSESFYNDYLSGHFDEYPIWIAKYSENKPKLRGEKNWIIWQFTDKGDNIQVPGIKKGTHIDLNVFNGGPEEFEDILLK